MFGNSISQIITEHHLTSQGSLDSDVLTQFWALIATEPASVSIHIHKWQKLVSEGETRKGMIAIMIMMIAIIMSEHAHVQ